MSTRQQLWEEVYQTARATYTEIPGYDDFDARLTADAAANSWYESKGWLSGHRKRPMHGLPKMPAPGNLLNLTHGRTCGFLSLESVNDRGIITSRGFDQSDEIPLLWSEDLRALFVFPYLNKNAPCLMPPTKRENKLAKIWAKGRPAKCSQLQMLPSPPLPVVFPGICISYRSDKFTHGVPKDYIHHFGANVRCYFSSMGNGRAPQAIMIRGGELRLTKDGIDG